MNEIKKRTKITELELVEETSGVNDDISIRFKAGGKAYRLGYEDNMSYPGTYVSELNGDCYSCFYICQDGTSLCRNKKSKHFQVDVRKVRSCDDYEEYDMNPNVKKEKPECESEYFSNEEQSLNQLMADCSTALKYLREGDDHLLVNSLRNIHGAAQLLYYKRVGLKANGRY